MKPPMPLSIPMLILALAAAPVVLADFYVYPNKGQSADQTEKDKFGCYQWAKGQTGFDPMSRPTASSAPPPKEAKEGGVGRGAVGGAALGGVVGALTGSTKKGLAIGAASGGLLGGMKRSSQKSRQEQNQAQWEQREASSYNQQRSEYGRAYKACLSGRGYTVQ